MTRRWTNLALRDLDRLYDFLSPASEASAARSIPALVAAPAQLISHPRLGNRLDEFEPRDVRKLLVGRYELRYELSGAVVCILRIFYTREMR